MCVYAEVVIEKTNYKVLFRRRETQFKPSSFLICMNDNLSCELRGAVTVNFNSDARSLEKALIIQVFGD